MIALSLLLSLSLGVPAGPGTVEGDVVMRAMRDELARTTTMKLPDSPAPYWASVNVFDSRDAVATAKFGALVDTEVSRSRVVSPRVRVGDFGLDAVGVPMLEQPPLVTFEDDYDALRHALWRFGDSAYKMAATGYREAQTEQAQRTVDPDRPASFAAATPTVTLGVVAPVELDVQRLEGLAKRVSAVFREHDHIQDCEVTVWAHDGLRRYIATDGGAARDGQRGLAIVIEAATQADDGEVLGARVVRVGGLGDFTDEASLIADAERIAADLAALRKAPLVRDYAGPVLLEPEAAAALLTMVVGNELISAGRWSTDIEAKLGQVVLPRGMSVVDDPGLTSFAGKPMFGGYRVDDEGTPAQRVELVVDGKLQTLLSGRTPGKKVKQSNGHARSGPFAMELRPAVSNLVISSKKGLGAAAMEKKLLSLVRARGMDHGIVIARGSGMGRGMMAYRIGKDGKRELVRLGFMRPPELAKLRELAAVGKEIAVVHHMQIGGHPFEPSGAPAELSAFASPMSVAAPAILLDDAEIHAWGDSHPKPPSYPKPALRKR